MVQTGCSTSLSERVERMKALVKTKPTKGSMEIMDMPKPEPKANEVLIKVKACGICGTDLKIQDGDFFADTPVIIGHEFSGTVEETGALVTCAKPGDRVVCEQHSKACGKCKFCLSGRRHLCPHKRSPGYLSDGAFAEYICMEESLVHKIPDNMTYNEAAILEPMAIAAHAIFEKIGIGGGLNAVILGCGPIALLTLQILKACGTANVYVTGIDADEEYRFKKALEYGAEETINVMKTDAVSRIKDLTDGGAELVIDLSGAPSAIRQGIDMLCKDGKFCAIGLPHTNVEIEWAATVLKAINFYFSYSSGFATWEKCIALISSGKVRVDDFTKDVYALKDWAKAFDKARSNSAMKVIINI